MNYLCICGKVKTRRFLFLFSHDEVGKEVSFFKFGNQRPNMLIGTRILLSGIKCTRHGLKIADFTVL